MNLQKDSASNLWLDSCLANLLETPRSDLGGGFK